MATSFHLGSWVPVTICLACVKSSLPIRAAIPNSEPSSLSLNPRDTSTEPTSSVAIN